MQIGPYEVRDCGDHAYLLSEGFATAYLVVGDERAALLDCGLGIGDMRAAAEELSGGKPLLLIATHAHEDHVGGMAQFDKMLISEEEAKHVKRITPGARKRWLRRKQRQGKADKSVRLFVGGGFPKLEIIKPGDVIDLGGRTLMAFATPGHTKGSISFYDEKGRRVFAGDAVSTYLFTFLLDSATVTDALNSVEAIGDLQPDLVWACHHRTPFDKDRLEKVRAALEALCKKKNTLLPGVKRFRLDGVDIFYRTDKIR